MPRSIALAPMPDVTTSWLHCRSVHEDSGSEQGSTVPEKRPVHPGCCATTDVVVERHGTLNSGNPLSTNRKLTAVAVCLKQVQLDSITSNELGDPDALADVTGRPELDALQHWRDTPNLGRPLPCSSRFVSACSILHHEKGNKLETRPF